MAKEIYLQFTMEDGTKYEVKDSKFAYCYKISTDGFKTRVSRVAVENAYDEYQNSEWGREELEAKKRAEEEAKKSDKAAERRVKKERRKSKDIAFEGCGITLTTKQVTFLKGMEKDDFWEQGIDSALWIDVYCDTMADTFNKIVMGALISTLKEKQLIEVGVEKVNGKNNKYFELTELGKQVAKEMGLA